MKVVGRSIKKIYRNPVQRHRHSGNIDDDDDLSFWAKQILRFVPFQKQINLLYNTGLLFLRILDPRATFKAVIMALDRYDICTPGQV